MPKRNKEYYVVMRSPYLTVPTIFSSWGDAHPLTDGFPNTGMCGFVTLAKAETHMRDQRVKNFDRKLKQGAGTTTPQKGKTAYYAVANGRKPGIKNYYYGSGGTEPEVVNFPGACHKHFRTLAQAEAFIEDWVEMYAYRVRANIKKELLDGNRPAKMKGLPVGLALRTGGSNDEDELTDGLGRLRVRQS